MNHTFKPLKTIEIILIIILALVLFAVIWGGYQNLVEVRNSTQLEQPINEVVIDWIKADSETTQLLEKTDKNLQGHMTRLEELGVEID
jgi:membrane protein involved in colicin uptake